MYEQNNPKNTIVALLKVVNGFQYLLQFFFFYVVLFELCTLKVNLEDYQKNTLIRGFVRWVQEVILTPRFLKKVNCTPSITVG